jgi:adenine-specific DNA-methyltransferase
MEKLKMHSPNLTQDNVARIRDLFPGCVTEAQREDGSVRLAVDLTSCGKSWLSQLSKGHRNATT